MAMYSFVPPFRETKFCGVPSCVFDISGCATGEKRLRNADLNDMKYSIACTSVLKFILPLSLTQLVLKTPGTAVRKGVYGILLFCNKISDYFFITQLGAMTFSLYQLQIIRIPAVIKFND
jgi:hypothetical protein